MADSWLEKYRRECRQMEAQLLTAMRETLDDVALRSRVEELAQRPRFAEFCWLWGPWLSKRDSVRFRPVMVSNFASFAVNGEGKSFNPWKGESAEPLEAWLAQVDAADDIELTRRLFMWRTSQVSLLFAKRQAVWSAELLRRIRASPSPARTRIELEKLKGFFLDAPTALELYRVAPQLTQAFILESLPFGWWGEKRSSWASVLDATKSDVEFHFSLYRKVVEPKRWAADVRQLLSQSLSNEALDVELERRHPEGISENAAEVFLELAGARGDVVLPYLHRHVSSIAPRWGFRRTEAKGLERLVGLAREKGWLTLWGALLRTGGSQALFDAEVKRLVGQEADTQGLLQRIAGPGHEANFPGVSFAQVHPLSDATAIALYRRFPELVRGPFRLHVAPGWHDAYRGLVLTAMAAGDDELIDFFASRHAMQPNRQKAWQSTVQDLVAHYEKLGDVEFVRRASSALSRMPAFAIWNLKHLLEHNALARLFFERSTALFLSDAAAVRDLLESPQIHVQALAFRILSQPGPRAAEVAAANVDLLHATVLRPLHRRTRLMSFAALRNAASHDEATARRVVERLRDAFALPDRRYPKEALVGLLGELLHRWPRLQLETEKPRVFGAATA